MSDRIGDHSLRLLLFTLLAITAMVGLGGGLVAALVVHYGLDVGTIGATFETVADRQHLRFILLINNLFSFGLSAMLALYFTYRHRWSEAAGLVPPVHAARVVPAMLAFLSGLPLIALLAYWNVQIDLPEWMVSSEASGNAILAGVLTFERVPELLLALLTVAVVPAFCEELMFRGLLQGRLLPGIMGGHAAVWVAAAIFSAIHVEFAGFLPRLLLGALLGYAYRWTGSLLVPILIHLLFNGIQVIMTYGSGEFTPDTEMDTALLPLLISGGLSLLALSYFVWRNERIYHELGEWGEDPDYQDRYF